MSVKQERRQAAAFEKRVTVKDLVKVKGRVIDFNQGHCFEVIPQDQGIITCKNLNAGQSGVIRFDRTSLIIGVSLDFYNREFNFSAGTEVDEDGNQVTTRYCLASYVIFPDDTGLLKVYMNRIA